MLSSSYNLILQVLSQIIEVVTITCNSHYQVAIQFRVLLCMSKGICIYNIELDMVSIKTEIASDKSS